MRDVCVPIARLVRMIRSYASTKLLFLTNPTFGCARFVQGKLYVLWKAKSCKCIINQTTHCVAGQIPNFARKKIFRKLFRKEIGVIPVVIDLLCGNVTYSPVKYVYETGQRKVDFEILKLWRCGAYESPTNFHLVTNLYPYNNHRFF